MKATISQDGILLIEPESTLEAFAFGEWWEYFSKRVTWSSGSSGNAGGIVMVPYLPASETSERL